MTSGIYFLFNKKRLVYIGQSLNVRRRIAQHRGLKNFDSYRSIPCEQNRLSYYENRLIAYFKPELNIHCGETTVVMRVPVAMVDAIKKLIGK